MPAPIENAPPFRTKKGTNGYEQNFVQNVGIQVMNLDHQQPSHQALQA